MGEREARQIRVLIVDDHPVVRDGLRVFFSITPDIICVGEAESGEETVSLCKTLLPEVILMDMRLPGMDGIETTRMVRALHPATQVIILSSFHDRQMVEAAIAAGAAGYLLKNTPTHKLAEAIRSAAIGQHTLAPEVTHLLVRSPNGNPLPGHDLTQREREILRLLAQGLTNAEISQRFVVSEHTIRFHVSNILVKMGARNRTELVRMAMEHKLI